MKDIRNYSSVEGSPNKNTTIINTYIINRKS